MNILVTGAKGFIGRNLIAELENMRAWKSKDHLPSSNLYIMSYDLENEPVLLRAYCSRADFVVHLAGINRPQDVSEYMQGNFGFTSVLLDTLGSVHSKAPVLVTSSIQAELDNPYGKSKKAGEELIAAYGLVNDIPVYIYRLPNVFGKWCRPNYNSAIATFCHNIACGLPIQVNDSSVQLKLVYIDDVVAEIIRAMEGKANKQDGLCSVKPVFQETLGHVVELLTSFKNNRSTLNVPALGDTFTKYLYAAYLSYLPEDSFSYPLKMNTDTRGSFTEMIRTPERGQFSVNIIKPGITKGNHWHHTKNEKFIVVSGNGVIRLRKVGEEPVYEYYVSGDKMEMVEIPTGYTHSIKNLCDWDMIVFMWASELFDPEHPDTHYLEV
jgi:UDP-2-acetamido-2,6-beta-L-arabino-hexul-4-ose reductase